MITIKNIQPLLDQGLKQVEIAQILNVHKTTIGKIIKGKIHSSRELGVKARRNTDSPCGTIWELIPADDVLRLIRWTSVYWSRRTSVNYVDIYDYVANWLYTRKPCHNTWQYLLGRPDPVVRFKILRWCINRTIKKDFIYKTKSRETVSLDSVLYFV